MISNDIWFSMSIYDIWWVLVWVWVWMQLGYIAVIYTYILHTTRLLGVSFKMLDFFVFHHNIHI
jgi:hypothetical protein